MCRNSETVYNVSVWNILINISAQFHAQVAEKSNFNLGKWKFLKVFDEMFVLQNGTEHSVTNYVL